MGAGVRRMPLGMARFGAGTPRAGRIGLREGACLMAGDVGLELPGPPPFRPEAHEHTHRDVSAGGCGRRCSARWTGS